MAVQEIIALKQEFHWPYARLCPVAGIAYPSFKRYRTRIVGKEPVIFPAGPKKIEPLDLQDLIAEIGALSHAHKRTRGTTEVRSHYRDRVSRREFDRIVGRVRLEINRERRASLRRVLWQHACVVWSMDETELVWCGQKIRFHQIQDLGSRYKFASVAVAQITAEQVAAKLEDLFARYGAPLVLKRDNGPALNGRAVNGVLEKHLVIPLNSPAYYPPYNGAMERAQRELKERVLENLPGFARYDHELFEAYAAAAASELNHNPRRSLGGQTSCQVFQSGKGALKPYSRRKRKEVFDWIKNLAVKIVAEMKQEGKRQANTAWRVAVETWLRRNGIITVSPGKTVTLFPKKNGS